MKLQFKVILLMMTILIVIGIISGGTMLYIHRKSSVQQFEHMATALAGAIQGSLEQGMLTGERKPTQEAMVRIGEEEMVSEVILLSHNGRIAASNNILDINKVSDREEVRRTLHSGEVSMWTKRQNNNSQLSVITPILNKPECQTCHSPGTTVLGAIQVSLDASSLDNQTRQQTIFFGAFGALTLLIMGIGLTFALRKIILTPLLGLAESAQKFSQGNYSIRTRSGTSDEIGMLARTFNEMAESVKQRTEELEISKEELARWNLDLEDKIRQRTKELEEGKKIREQLLEKLISAQEDERRRIARELHDDASQSLAALVLHLEDIADNLPARYHATKRRLDVLKEQLVQTVGGIRNLALELRPGVLDHLGLPKAIEWYVKDYLGKRGLDAKIDITVFKIKLPSYTETMLFRIIQEALTNVVKHAQASQVTVRLQLSDSKVSLQIEDNGKGFDVDAALSGLAGQKNLGLHGMIERAALLGGALNIHSETGKGTCLSIEVPLMEEASANK